MKRLILPGIPFVFSLALSLSTAGSHCYWQDSGFFLVAVKELGILYPPGFALYVLLCKAWTLMLGFVDFTYAVHLFSAFCAAGAAGTLAVAARDLLRTKGPIFRTVEEEGPLAVWAGAAVGCLAAGGYTFWAAAILAKVYSFYYLILTLLIWRMIRADEDRRPRDFTIVALLIGLAWQAHPSATNTGLALVLFVAFHRSVVGGKGLAWRALLAAAAAVGPLFLLPLFKAAGGSALQFGDPGTWDGFWEYALGRRFTGNSANFGLEGSRVASVGRYFWEDFLGIGVLLVGAGLFRLWKTNRRLLIGLAAWILPVFVVTVLFKLEGQHDFWFMAAWIPLWLVAALGLSRVGKYRQAAAAAALAGTIWAVAANRPDLDQRHYTLAEAFGHAFLDSLEPDSILELGSDDGSSTVLYLQRIRSVRPDVFVDAPPATGISRRPPSRSLTYAEVLRRKERSPDEPALQRPWGPFLVDIQADSIKPWSEPMPAEEVVRLFRRARGQHLDRFSPPEIRVSPEPYERRLLLLLLLARKRQADELALAGKLASAARLYESLLALDPSMSDEATVIMPLAVTYVGLQRFQQSESLLKKALTLDLSPAKRAEAYYFLAALCGERPEGAEWKAKALASPELPSKLRAKLEGR